MLVIDHSGSMASTDVQPTRLWPPPSAAANTFLDQLPGSRASARSASGPRPTPSSSRSPTTALPAPPSTRSRPVAATDTGDALNLALQLLHGSSRKHPPSAIVLLSDGAANAGPDPVTVGASGGQRADSDLHRRARHANGTLANPDPLQPPIPVPPDPQLMKRSPRPPGRARSTPRAPISSARSTSTWAASSAASAASAR